MVKYRGSVTQQCVRRYFDLCRTESKRVHMYIESVPRSKHSVSVIKTSQSMLYREIIAVCSQIHTKHTNTLCGQNVELYIKIQSVPRSKHHIGYTNQSVNAV